MPQLLPSGHYLGVIQKQIAGQRHRESKAFPSQKQAELWERERLKQIIQEYGQRQPAIGSRKTISEVYSEFVRHYEAAGRSPRTIKEVRTAIEVHLIAALGDKPIGEIKLEDYDRVSLWLQGRQVKNKTVNKHLGYFKGFMQFAVDRGHINFNPITKSKKLPVEDAKFRYWTKDEVRYFLSSAIGDYWELLYKLAIYTGMRLSELAGLQKGDIDWGNKQINLKWQLGDFKIGNRIRLKGQKGIVDRVIPLNDAVLGELKAKCESLGDNDFIFRDQKGLLIDSSHFTARVFKPTQAYKFGIRDPIKFHSLRHTYASHFMMNGGSIFVLQKLLGHKDIQTTMVYSHLDPNALDGARNVVNFD